MLRGYKYIRWPVQQQAACFILILSRQKRSVYDDPLRGGWPALYVRWQIAYVCENHVRFYDGVYGVEMSVSLFNIFTFNKEAVAVFPSYNRSPHPLFVKGRQR